MVRKFDRRRFIAATGAIGIAGLAGCNGGGGEDGEDGTPEETPGEDETPEDGEDGGDTRLAWHAGGTGGTYFPLSNEFKDVIENDTDFTVQVESTGASVENVGSLANGGADFALIQNDVGYYAVEGEGIEAFEGEPIENLLGVATLYPETIHIVTRADAEISGPADLEGTTINTGDLGSGTQVNALQILDALGIEEFTEQNTGFSQAADQLKNDDIDAAFVVGGWPVGAIEELATTTDVDILALEDEDREAVLDTAPFFAEDEIPGGTYNGVEEDSPTVSVQAMIATNEEQPDDTVEQVTAAIFDNVDDLTIKTDFIGVDSAMDGMSIEVHSGAAAYFEEEGVEIPENGGDGGDGDDGTETPEDG